MVKHLSLAVVCILLMEACENPRVRVETNVEAPVSVEEVVFKSIEKFVEATGTVVATQEAVLTTEASGDYRLAVNPRTSRPYALGDAVRKDDVIVSLDNPEQENTIKLESHRLELENAQREFEKQQSLYEKGGVTLRELKTAERSYVDARYNHENAQFQLEKLKVKAPFPGILTDITIFTPGVRIGANVQVAHLMSYMTMSMEINLPGKLMGDVRVGQPVRVANYTSQGRQPDKLDAVIAQVSPALDPGTRTFKATVHIKNPNLVLRPGMFVKAEIVTDRHEDVVVAPKDVILTRRSRKTLFIVNEGVAQERAIETGLENPETYEIISGLDVGELLVVEGFETLRNGSRVKITQ